MKAAIIYTSITGNTEVLAEQIYEVMVAEDISVDLITVDEFDYNTLADYDFLAVGTYTWDNGEIPLEMEELFTAFETQDVKHIMTGVFGTGDSFYPYYCGAVDLFRDMLYVQTDLAVTLKVELMPQQEDLSRAKQFSRRLVRPLVTV
ncbi:putative flavodoxin-1 [Paraliobacillus quinghaiensis]|uniref:Flavodoxin-1 n=1 Tax=Paraliobacillus quinghaiensis TaxID=470815 RepID=A0A917WUH8_9BACI|nr:flavodoxin domain-containing protein [Paraliobacillus quinghaiensis]GGM29890.1 putative flavodoxin-1 [Paraliobacillus quinghaiensis]